MMRPRTWISIGSILALLLLVIFTGHWIIESQLRNWKPLFEELLHLKYGVRCDMGELHYRFPDGVRVKGIGISLENKRLVEAKEVIARVSLTDLLEEMSFPPRHVKSIEATGVNVYLERSVRGEWKVPSFSERLRGADTDKKPSFFSSSPIRCTIHDLGVDLSTPRGSMRKRYDRLEALFDPTGNTGKLIIEGGDEKLNLNIQRSPERRIEIQADSLSLQPIHLFTSPVFPFERLFLRGKVQIQERSSRDYTFMVTGSIFGKGVDAPLKVQFDIEGAVTQAQLEETRGTLFLFGEKVDFSLTFVKERKPAVTFTVMFPDFSYERAVAAVPLSLRPHLPDLKVSGFLKGTFSAIIGTAPPYRSSYRFAGESRPLRVLSLGPGIRISRLKEPFVHTFRTEKGKIVRLKVGPENPDFVPYEEIPPDLIRAVITAEDGSFFRHRGISVLQVMEAMADNILAGRVLRGASTITMQLAKNLYLSKERTFSRKFEELFIARAIEQELSKERILEIYLNIIEWGDDVYGLAPAARYYFQKRPDELTKMECAFLASIIARPKDGWKPDPLARITHGWQQYLDLIVRKMGEKEIPSEPEP